MLFIEFRTVRCSVLSGEQGTAQSGLAAGMLASASSIKLWHLGHRLGIIVCFHVRCGSRV
jgi:hypothetical protein